MNQHHNPLLLPLLRPPNSLRHLPEEVVEAGRDPVLEAVLKVGGAPSGTTGAGSPSRSLPHPVTREQAAPSSFPEPVRGGVGVSIAINDLPGLQQDDLGGTLKLGNFI